MGKGREDMIRYDTIEEINEREGDGCTPLFKFLNTPLPIGLSHLAKSRIQISSQFFIAGRRIFTSKSRGEKILKIDPHTSKLW